jgi:hypothetical protein
MVLFGEEYLAEIKKAVEAKTFTRPNKFGTLPEWKSLNDQLKVHPFMYWHNLK